MIGGRLLAALREAGRAVIGTSRRRPTPQGMIPLDLAAGDAPLPATLRGGIAFLCAGITRLDLCEQQPEATARINVGNTLRLAGRLAERGCRIVYPSTNLVLDGGRAFQRADAPYAPACAYGRQKMAVEQGIGALDADVAILRMTKILPPTPALLAGWVRTMRAGQPIRPLRDLVMAPIPLETLIDVLLRLGTAPGRGLYQVSGDRDLAYSDVAQALARRFGCDPALVQPATARELGLVLNAAPRHTTLDCARVTAEFAIGSAAAMETLAGLQFDE